MGLALGLVGSRLRGRVRPTSRVKVSVGVRGRVRVRLRISVGVRG